MQTTRCYQPGLSRLVSTALDTVHVFETGQGGPPTPVPLPASVADGVI